jgi:hypothetical protein
MVSHSNFSSSTVQSDQIFSHPRDDKVGNVICIHWVYLTAKVNPPMLFRHNFNLSVMSLTSYSNKTACKITITEVIKQTFSCHLLVKSHNIPACKYKSNWPAHSRNVLLFLLWHSSFLNPWQWYKCEALHTSYSSHLQYSTALKRVSMYDGCTCTHYQTWVHMLSQICTQQFCIHDYSQVHLIISNKNVLLQS